MLADLAFVAGLLVAAGWMALWVIELGGVAAEQITAR
jgi:hypothetical protein